jgi:hypothetical protein
MAAIGFALVAPIWFRAPIRWRGFFESPQGLVTYRRRFSALDGVLSIGGYLLIVLAVVVWAVSYFRA